MSDTEPHQQLVSLRAQLTDATEAYAEKPGPLRAHRVEQLSRTLAQTEAQIAGDTAPEEAEPEDERYFYVAYTYCYEWEGAERDMAGMAFASRGYPSLANINRVIARAGCKTEPLSLQEWPEAQFRAFIGNAGKGETSAERAPFVIEALSVWCSHSVAPGTWRFVHCTLGCPRYLSSQELVGFLEDVIAPPEGDEAEGGALHKIVLQRVEAWSEARWRAHRDASLDRITFCHPC
jgi:hypothetical protein